MLFRDLRGYQGLVFGAYVCNAMFFATLPHYLAQKNAPRRLKRFGTTVLSSERQGPWSKVKP